MLEEVITDLLCQVMWCFKSSEFNSQTNHNNLFQKGRKGKKNPVTLPLLRDPDWWKFYIGICWYFAKLSLCLSIIHKCYRNKVSNFPFKAKQGLNKKNEFYPFNLASVLRGFTTIYFLSLPLPAPGLLSFSEKHQLTSFLRRWLLVNKQVTMTCGKM